MHVPCISDGTILFLYIYIRNNLDNVDTFPNNFDIYLRYIIGDRIWSMANRGWTKWIGSGYSK